MSTRARASSNKRLNHIAITVGVIALALLALLALSDRASVNSDEISIQDASRLLQPSLDRPVFINTQYAHASDKTPTTITAVSGEWSVSYRNNPDGSALAYGQIPENSFQFSKLPQADSLEEAVRLMNSRDPDVCEVDEDAIPQHFGALSLVLPLMSDEMIDSTHYDDQSGALRLIESHSARNDEAVLKLDSEGLISEVSLSDGVPVERMELAYPSSLPKLRLSHSECPSDPI